MNEERKDLTGALKALESNNQIITPEEREKRSDYITAEGERVSASLIKPIRTLEGDTANLIQKQGQSISSMRVAEQKKHPEKIPQIKTYSEHSGIRKIVTLLSIILSVISITGVIIYLSYIKQQNSTNPAVVVNTPPPMIDAKTSTDINYDSSKKIPIATLIREASSQKQLSPEDVEILNIKNSIEFLKIEDVLSGLSQNTPGTLLRSLGTMYVIGFVQKEQKEPFIIIKINNPENAFAGMLSWETSLGTIFSGIKDNNTTQNIVFKDILIKNKDARILRDDDGNGQILYSFYNKKTLVITTNESVYSTLINLLNNAPVIQ